MEKKKLYLNEALSILKGCKTEFTSAYGVTDIGIFGSIARGETGLDSDVDIVVKMKKPDIFFMVHIKEILEKEYQRKVDIVHYGDKMNTFLKQRIDRDAAYV